MEPGQPSPHADDSNWPFPPHADDSDWPFPSFKAIAHWGAMTFGPASAGLRHGLAVAVQELMEEGGQDVLPESDEEILMMAIFCLQEMHRRIDEEAAWLIAEARYKGTSWAKIARALEVTRQAAHKRFSARVDFILNDQVPGQRWWAEHMAPLVLSHLDTERTDDG